MVCRVRWTQPWPRPLRLTGPLRSPDLGRVHANQQLQVRPRCAEADRLFDPVEHVRKRVGPIVELSVPDDIGEETDDRPRGVQPGLGDQRLERRVGRVVEVDPILRAVPAAIEIGVDLSFVIVVELHRLPGVRRLVEQRVVIGVIVGEEEAALSVGDVPGRERNRVRA